MIRSVAVVAAIGIGTMGGMLYFAMAVSVTKDIVQSFIENWRRK